MDIAITLPKSLWDKIVSGEKSIELRKNQPYHFDIDFDRVYVVLKGSSDIVGYFNIAEFVATSPSCLMTSQNWLRKIAVSQDWISHYIEGASLVHLWFIGKVFQYKEPLSRPFTMKLSNNPQSYIYLK